MYLTAGAATEQTLYVAIRYCKLCFFKFLRMNARIDFNASDTSHVTELCAYERDRTGGGETCDGVSSSAGAGCFDSQ